MNSNGGNDNPYAPPGLLDNDLSSVQRIPALAFNRNWDRLLVGLNMTICVVGAAAALVDIESIVFSGLCILAAGLLLIAREVHCRRWERPAWQLNLWLGISGPFFALSLAAMIAIRGWSPQQAVQFKVHWVVASFAAGFVALSVTSLMKYAQDSRTEQRATSD